MEVLRRLDGRTIVGNNMHVDVYYGVVLCVIYAVGAAVLRLHYQCTFWRKVFDWFLRENVSIPLQGGYTTQYDFINCIL